MLFSLELIKDGLFVRLEGEFDLLVADKLRDEINKALKKSAARHLILDFSKLTFIDSSGLGVILGRYRQLAPMGGKVTIIGSNSQVYKILELSGLTRVITVEEPIKDRIARLKEEI
ncbi:MAG: STAS domain-containing protein [Bacillota bacterium]|jgi:stage II sporulation protein AA (anti-sigma F factor antagonist)